MTDYQEILEQVGNMNDVEKFIEECEYISKIKKIFWSKVKQSINGCQEWTGCLSLGYGVLVVHRSNKRAHRWAYEQFVRELGDDEQLDHLCRNKKCVNILHLEPVTSRENTLRGIGPTSLNAKKRHCKRGHEYTKENTYFHKNGRWRDCKICRKAHTAKRDKTRTDNR